MSKTPRIGWVRADQAASPQILDELAELSRENRNLREEIEQLRKSNVSKIPKLELFLNGQKEIQLSYNKEITKKHGLIYPIKQYPHELIDFISQRSVENYNASVGRNQLEVGKYNELMDIHQRVKLFGEHLTVTVINHGEIKANQIFIDISFPPEILITNSNSLDTYKRPHLPKSLNENPLSQAREAKRRWDDRNSSLMIFGDFSAETNKVYGLADSTDQSESDPIIDKNKITFFIKDLLHTRKMVFSNKNQLVALKPGKFTAKATVICEEYKEAQEFEIPIIVTENVDEN